MMSGEEKKTGRPTLLTEDLAERICDLVEGGAFIVHAAAEVGIGERTLLRWLSMGEKDDADELHRAFWQGCERARARAEARLWESIASKSEPSPRAVNPGDWKADLERLRAMNPKRYRESKHTEVTGADGGPVQVVAPVIMIPPESDD